MDAKNVEVDAYYVVAEALTNVARNALASVVETVCGHGGNRSSNPGSEQRNR
jgi:hypothetical protein